MLTKVVHCMREPFDYYIGRPTKQFPHGSIYGNPFIIGRDGTRNEVISKYRKWLWGLIDLPGAVRPSIGDVFKLHSHTIGCWCKGTQGSLNVPCHGDVLARIADTHSYMWYCFFKTAHPSWHFLEQEFHSPYMIRLSQMLGSLETADLCPLPHRVFRAFRLPKQKIRVVIIGQDPYPNTKHANGLAFAYGGTDNWPKSLQNIYKECVSDSKTQSFDPTLVRWMRQGVFLLNTSLTTVSGKPGAHSSWGWQDFTEVTVNEISKAKNIVFVLWGKHAQSLSDAIEPGNIILEAAHPSPFSCQDFFGCKHFSKTNVWLIRNGFKPIRW